MRYGDSCALRQRSRHHRTPHVSCRMQDGCGVVQVARPSHRCCVHLHDSLRYTIWHVCFERRRFASREKIHYAAPAARQGVWIRTMATAESTSDRPCCAPDQPLLCGIRDQERSTYLDASWPESANKPSTVSMSAHCRHRSVLAPPLASATLVSQPQLNSASPSASNLCLLPLIQQIQLSLVSNVSHNVSSWV